VKDGQQQPNPAVVVVPGDFVAIILWLPSLPYTRSAPRLILRRICPGYLQVSRVPFFVCLGIANVGLA